MKKILTTVITFLALAFISFTYSCKPDVCLDVVCANSGACNNGKCACQVGYEGLHCETIMRDKFIGSWQVQEDGTLSPAALYATSIEAGTLINEVKLHNVQNTFTAPVRAIVKADTITIPLQAVQRGAVKDSISGYGFIKGTNPLDQHYYQHATVTFFYTIKNNLNQINDYGVLAGLPSNWSK